MDDLHFWKKVADGYPTEYAYGPEWVGMAMYIGDYPPFYTKEEAKNYWEKTLKREFNTNAGCKNNETAEDYSTDK